MTREEIQSEYSALSLRYGDLCFKIKDVESQLSSMVTQRDLYEQRRQHLLKALQEVPNDNPVVENPAGES